MGRYSPGQGEGPQAPSPGLLGTYPTCDGHIRPPGLARNPSQRKKQINKKYILTLSSPGAGWQGGQRTGPGPLKERANSKKRFKVERISEATAGQWGLSGLRGGVRRPGSPDLGPGLEAVSSSSWSHPHEAKKRNVIHDWPSPARVRQGHEALSGQRTEQTPGLQQQPESGKGEGLGWPGRRPGARVPLKMCSCSIWGSGGAESCRPLSGQGVFSSWEGGMARGGMPWPRCPRHTEACPVQPAGLGALGACGFVLPFGDGK